MAIFMQINALFLSLTLLICTLSAVSGGKKGVTQITDESWQQILQGEWLVEFYAPWCPACKALAPTWEAVGNWAVDLDINVASVDVTEEAGLSGRFMITSLPSVYHVIDGEFRRYMGPRTENDIITFIEDRKFQEVEMISSWRAPDSIAMGIVSFIFKISMKVRVFHTVMTEEYGFPWWSTYGFVGVATVFMGLTLGMILVFLTDCCCPAKPPTQYVMAPPQQQRPQEGNIAKDDEETKEGDEDKSKEGENEAEEGIEGQAGEKEGDGEESAVRQRNVKSNEEEESGDK